ncbi:TetR/AcrR family transcriptional regulator C-terminal domain-containing protein [Rhodococcus sp. MSC1_016]|jgi:AcrR family transcriptional regulator|uniref:TetR/AcrR family transcriptional regulator C-terminal domain-containing protein n=1 Tax=Rhodococcus sp. MSC1_016 TaxID=2909266 RepID=UPI00202DECCB|nr:TetR/AcrR family transcriptional regulator C-terminal domain-containing protein [Rhodococcus sp. MSC1_016]
MAGIATPQGGDPARTMELLWGGGSAPVSRPRRGQAGLNLDRIVDVAIGLADAEGLDAVSMRRLAAELGAGAMSLYTHVPGKVELVDVMTDRMLSTLHAAPDGSADPVAAWRDRLAAAARGYFELLRAHPWMLNVVTLSRPVLGPGAMAKYERELAAVEGLGLSDLEMDSVVTLVDSFAVGAARAAAEAAALAARGDADSEWWRSVAPHFEKVFDADRFPLAARVGASAGEHHNAAFAPDHAFEFGLARLLDGIGALIRNGGRSLE